MAIKPRKPTGLKDINKNLMREVAGIRRRERAGLTVIALGIKRGSMRHTPVRVGNLRSGHAVSDSDGEQGSSGDFEGIGSGGLSSGHETHKHNVVGEIRGLKLRKVEAAAVIVSPEYALEVHENPNAGTAGYDGSKDTPNKRAEDVHSKVGGHDFLKNASQEMAGKANKILAQYARLKK